MANHKSSEKRARSSERKREQNRRYLSSVRTAVKNFKAAVTAGALREGETIVKLLTSAQSMLAKAAAKGMIHKNKASRSIGRLAVMMQAPAEKHVPLKKTGGKAKATAATAAKKVAVKSKTAVKKPVAKKKK